MNSYKYIIPILLLLTLLLTTSIAQKETSLQQSTLQEESTITLEPLEKTQEGSEIIPTSKTSQREPKVYVDPNDDTKKIVEIAPFPWEDFVSVEKINDPDPRYTEKYQSLHLHFKDAIFEEIKANDIIILKRGEHVEENRKGILLENKKIVFDFLGCADFQENQCGLRVNGIPIGRLEKDKIIELNDETSLIIKDIDALFCDKIFCDIEHDAYSTLHLQVTQE